MQFVSDVENNAKDSSSNTSRKIKKGEADSSSDYQSKQKRKGRDSSKSASSKSHTITRKHESQSPPKQGELKHERAKRGITKNVGGILAKGMLAEKRMKGKSSKSLQLQTKRDKLQKRESS